jgi:transposase
MPAKYVRPSSKGQKNDFRDAEAIAEAGALADQPFAHPVQRLQVGCSAGQ